MKVYTLKTLCFLAVCGLFSCQKDVNEPIGADGLKVSFDVNTDTYIDNPENGDDLLGKKSSIKKSNISFNLVDVQQYKDEDVEFAVWKEELGVNLNEKIKTSGKTQQNGNIAVAPEYPDNYFPAAPIPGGRQLTNGVKFRVMIYDQNNNFIDELDGTAGSIAPPTTTKLKQGTTYKWFSYSYYSSLPLAPIPTANKNNPSLNVMNEDFLYAFGTFTTGVDAGNIPETKVKITFKHMMAMVEMSVLTGGFAAKADLAKFLSQDASRPYIRVHANVIEQGVFNLLSGTFTSKSKVTTPVYVNALSNYAYAVNYPVTSYHGFIFTVPGGNNEYINDFTYTVEPWLILDRPAAPRIYNKTFTDKIRIDKGMSSRLRVVPFDLGIKVPGNSNTGDVNWSRGDLYYDKSQGFTNLDGFTRWQHRNHEGTSITYASSLKPYGVTTPTPSYGQQVNNFGSTYYPFNAPYPLATEPTTTTQDPCNGLQPNGSLLNDRWRTPTIAQGVAFANYFNQYANTGRISHTFVSASGTDPGKLIVVVNIKDGTADDWTDRISFEMKGYAKYTSGATPEYVMEPTSIPQVNANRQIGEGYYRLVVADGYAYLKITANSGSSPKFNAQVFSSKSTATTGDIIKARLNVKDAINVRCVRNFPAS